MSFELPKLPTELPKLPVVKLPEFTNPLTTGSFAELIGRLSSPPPPPPPSPPPGPPSSLDIIDRLDSCDVVGPLAAVCLLACGVVLFVMLCKPIARTAEFSLLVGAQLVGALIQADYLYVWIAGPPDLSADLRFDRSMAFEEWLRHFSSFGTSLYFLTLSVQDFSLSLSIYLSIFLSICLYLSICISIHLSVYLSIYQPVYLSIKT